MSIVVVGSGPSGVHFAQTLLAKGHDVTLIDAGRTPPDPVMPDRGLNELKEELDDPAAYFLGRNFEGVSLPRDSDEYYGIPPHKQYIFDVPPELECRADGFEPLFSFAQGGLAQAWTGGCYPFNEHELAEFPFPAEALSPAYDEVAKRIGISGLIDDLAPFIPAHEHLQGPLPLDESSEILLRRYERRRAILNAGHGLYLGRSRVATLTRPLGDREPCSRLGRCLWGCPTSSLYTPELTLKECLRSSRFRYVPGVYVTSFRCDDRRRVNAVVAKPVAGGDPIEIPAGRLALAAGALSTTRILLQSVFESSGELPRLGGLMDNRQVLVPFSNLRMLGRPFEPRNYQYNKLCLGIEVERPAEYVHGLVTTLTTAMIHPIAQQLPLDLATALYVTRAMHSTLGLVNLNFHDTRREDNQVWLTPRGDENLPRLTMAYRPPSDEGDRLRYATKVLRRALLRLGCVVPPGMVHARPMGSGVHYSGTLPMTLEDRPYTTRPDGSSRDFDGLVVVDGATFPFLPAKNITFTLMANAVRIAETAF
ncbi:MAG: GMC oxidoreductase [Gemmatimonadota bacterium]